MNPRAVPPVVSALLWGSFSAASFPAGALVGLLVSVSSTMTGLLIAFGAGALIFAVTVELFGELLERIKDDTADLLDVTIEFVAVVVGASAYMRINAGLLRWASHADHWRRLRSSGVERVGRACVAVSERIGQPLTPDMTPAMQAQVLEHVFRCFIGAHIEGVSRQELLHVLAALGLQASEEEVDVLITEHCRDDSANAMLTTHEFVAIARAYLKASSSAAASSLDATRLDDSGEASAVATASVDGDQGVSLGSLAHQPSVQCESGQSTAEGSVGEEAADWAADEERKAPRTEAAARAAESIAATVAGVGGEAASTAACAGVEDTSDLEHLLHTERLLNEHSGRSTSYYHMPWHSLHRPRRRLRLLLMDVTEGMDSSVLSIWLGVCMDGLPEAVLIGLLAMQRRMSVPFIISVFVANFPEAMSCAALCKQREMKPLPVILMWAFLCLMTGVVAMATAWVFTNERVSDDSLEFYRIKEVAEGLAAGAMLTCVAAAMIPEAIHLGGEGAGFVLVMGFLSATLIKILELAPRDALRW